MSTNIGMSYTPSLTVSFVDNVDQLQLCVVNVAGSVVQEVSNPTMRPIQILHRFH